VRCGGRLIASTGAAPLTTVRHTWHQRTTGPLRTWHGATGSTWHGTNACTHHGLHIVWHHLLLHLAHHLLHLLHLLHHHGVEHDAAV